MTKRGYLILLVALSVVGGGALASLTALKNYAIGARAAVRLPRPSCGTAVLPRPADVESEEVFIEPGPDGRYLDTLGQLQGRLRIAYKLTTGDSREVIVPLAAKPETCADARIKEHLIVAQSDALETEKGVCRELDQIARGLEAPRKPGAPNLTPEKARSMVERLCLPYGLLK